LKPWRVGLLVEAPIFFNGVLEKRERETREKEEL